MISSFQTVSFSLIVSAETVEVNAVSTCMTEYSIENDVYPSLLCFSSKMRKLLVCSKCRIYLIIVSRVIVMVGSRFEYRIKVYPGNSQRLEIIKLFLYPPETSPVDRPLCYLAGIIPDIIGRPVPVVLYDPFRIIAS